MKKILVSLLVLALCTPAMAATVTINDNGDGTGTIVVDAGEPNAIVGLALNIDATGGNITVASIDGTANPTFNIYPDAAHDLEEAEEGSYTYGAGTPIANQEAAGEVAVSNSFAISVGALNGEETPGADGASTVTINIEVDADTNICVEENALRGGIVLAGGEGVDIEGEIVCDDITVAAGCVDQFSGAALTLYNDYVANSADPSCWCWQYQCEGDADNGTEDVFIEGTYRIYDADLTLLSNNWKKAPSSGANPCADFDHMSEDVFIEGTYSIYDGDLTILSNNWKATDGDLTNCSTYLE